MAVIKSKSSNSLLHRLFIWLRPHLKFLPLCLLLLLCWALVNLYKIVLWRSADSAAALLLGGTTTTSSEEAVHKVAGLTCPAFSHPELNQSFYDDALKEIIYWEDIPKDAHVPSPYRCDTRRGHKINKAKAVKKFLTFEPDEAGWNNIRMAMETVIAMAVVMGRTLVLPPHHQIWNLDHPHKHPEKGIFGFEDFFHLESIEQEHPGLEIISFREFLETEVITGHILRDSATGQPNYPPDNRTDWNGMLTSWDGAKRGENGKLWTWWRGVALPLSWTYHQCVAVFPQASGECKETGWVETLQEDEDRVNGYLAKVFERDEARKQELKSNGDATQLRRQSYWNKPTPVDAPPVDRLSELLHERKQLCVYDRNLQDAPVLHAKGEQSDTRFLVHFYAFLFLESSSYDLWLKRFVRDHLRYVDEIQCASARIVAALKQIAFHPVDNPNGNFDTIHIRRGDFQRAYSGIVTDAETIYTRSTKNWIPDNRVVYISSDEKDKKFFEPLAQRYRLKFLTDFKYLLNDVNPNYYGMLEQLIASNGEVFVGTYFSTFSGFINRLRGYRSQKRKDPGHELGLVKSFHYSGTPQYDGIKEIMRNYHAVEPSAWTHEFPVCWRDLDHDLNQA